MTHRSSLFLLVLALWIPAQTVSAQTFREVSGLGELFRAQGVTGTFVLFDREADTMLVWNEARAKKRFTPASTFKIANSIIGLDTGAVKDVDEILPYGGKPQRIKEWERDMGLRDAIKISNVAIYQELARRIGLERMRAGVKRLGYGNMEIGEVVDRFWLDGPLAISAVEQTEFLGRLVDKKLPVSSGAIRAVTEITVAETTEAYELHAKAGWLFEEKLGWWVGWVVRDGKAYPFALNIDLPSDTDAAKRIPLGRECLRSLGKL
ncbi:MAG: class D beta-lactamase [Chthoniobacterales bacterium]